MRTFLTTAEVSCSICNGTGRRAIADAQPAETEAHLAAVAADGIDKVSRVFVWAHDPTYVPCRTCKGSGTLDVDNGRNPLDGPVYLVKRERDCDCAEWTVALTFEAITDAEAAIEASYADAEGPVRWCEITREEYEEFEPSERDRAAEAWENGRGTAVII